MVVRRLGFKGFGVRMRKEKKKCGENEVEMKRVKFYNQRKFLEA